MTANKRAKAEPNKAAVAKRKDKFVEAMVANGGNKRAAAIEAGYKPGRAADKAGERLSHNVAVVAEIEKRISAVMAKVAEKTEVTKEWITASLKTVAERCMQASPVVDRKGDPVMTETPDGTVAQAFEFNSAGANRALELLGKEQGMFIERTMVVKDPLEKFSPQELRDFYAILKSRQEARKGVPPATAVH